MAAKDEEKESGWGLIPLSTPIADLEAFRRAITTPGLYCPHEYLDADTYARVSAVEADGVCSVCNRRVRDPMGCSEPGEKPLQR